MATTNNNNNNDNNNDAAPAAGGPMAEVLAFKRNYTRVTMLVWFGVTVWMLIIGFTRSDSGCTYDLALWHILYGLSALVMMCYGYYMSTKAAEIALKNAEKMASAAASGADPADAIPKPNPAVACGVCAVATFSLVWFILGLVWGFKDQQGIGADCEANADNLRLWFYVILIISVVNCIVGGMISRWLFNKMQAAANATNSAMDKVVV